MTELDLLLGAIDDTADEWEPDDAALHILQLLRHNLVERMNAAESDQRTYSEEDPF